MNKKELCAEVSRRTGCSVRAATAIVTEVFDIISEQLATGSSVKIVGFGKFALKHRNSRTGRNMNTGDVSPVVIPDRLVPQFLPGKPLTERMDSGVKQKKGGGKLYEKL